MIAFLASFSLSFSSPLLFFFPSLSIYRRGFLGTRGTSYLPYPGAKLASPRLVSSVKEFNYHSYFVFRRDHYWLSFVLLEDFL